jgi:hypothetical protein
MFVTVISVAALIVTIAGVIWLVWVAAHGDPERQAESDAREFFSAHGHWPDEDPPEDERT